MTTIASELLVLAAVASWRWSRLVSAALWIALVGEGLDAISHAMALRAIYVITGTLGLLAMMRAFNTRPAHWRRTMALGGLLVWSSMADGVSLLLWRLKGIWGPQPVLEIGVLVAVTTVSLWPWRTYVRFA